MNRAPVLPAGLDLSLCGLFRRLVAAFQVPAASSRSDLYRLAKGATLAVRRPQGSVIECRWGSLWITFDDTPQDIVIDAGESHVAVQRSRMLVHALSDSALRLVADGGAR
ncbi:MAG: DUF2917 domain-containing protein [Gammaproteobacteria bacterium]|uniref:DUF2917 domain-containing protein n=1 Tax=Azohydromonas sp. TaxID=1872666 RepID=UPI002B5D25FC|nr:DUF2917 domain-containing protein [Azohydromonas sp.]HMM85139.1 DUF2917 domain-containing protein [Azohydromonas sp.]